MYPQMLLYRLRTCAESRRDGYYLGPALLEEEQQCPERRRVKADVERLTSTYPDLFALRDAAPDDYGHYLAVDPSRAKPTLSELSAELISDETEHGTFPRPFSDFDLLAAVVARGDVYSFYGSTYWDSGFDVFHVLSCGINWSEYAGVTSQRWRSFSGTFAEDNDYRDVMEAELRCRCGAVRVKFGMPMPSLARVIVTLSAGQLEQLFEDGDRY